MKCFKKLQIAAASALLFAALLFIVPLPNASAADATSAAGQVTLTSGSLNVRSAADASGTILTQLPAGTYVTLISKSGNWWRVEYAPGTYGYASANYIRVISGTTTMRTTGNLNVRSGPGTSYAIRDVLSYQEPVIVLSQTGKWCQIVYDGTKSGYASASYLSSVMAWPVPASHKINQYFSSHEGIDVGASVRGVSGDDIIAAQSSKVVYAGWLNGYGYVVYINSVYNGQPIQTRFGHLVSAPLVAAGQTVGAGQRIGYMGNTGTSSGVHLHFEVRIRNAFTDCISNAESTPVNPLWYVS
jgi:murein DD-endopeptidase MepM/ murein hydrolase activator NlpD